MPTYKVTDGLIYKESGMDYAREIEATDPESACEEAMKKAFSDYGWEDEWHNSAPDWVVMDEKGQMFEFTSAMEYDPVFLVYPKKPEKP